MASTRHRISKEQMQIYIARVAKMLMETNYTVHDIFATLDIANGNNVRDAFKARYGTTYAAFRNQARKQGHSIKTIKENTKYAKITPRTDDEVRSDARKIAKLLESTNMSLYQIHRRLGFSDGTRTREVFESIYGMPYSRYRKEICKLNDSDDVLSQEPQNQSNQYTELVNMHKRDADDTKDTLMKAAELLTTTDLQLHKIFIRLDILDQPKFNKDFRSYYGCTPTEYRNNNGDLNAINASGKSTVANQDFDFTVTIRQVLHHASPIPGDYDISTTMQIPFLVNDLYEYRAQIITTSGQCPVTDPYEFMKSEYREKFNDIVVKTVMPFYHGQLNIAYMQTLPQSVYSGGFPVMPSRRPSAAPKSGDPRYIYPQTPPGFEHER